MSAETEKWRRVEELYDEALDLAVDERAAFLDQACASDEELRREVESLLAAHERAGDFIVAPALEVAASMLAEDQSLTGRQVDHYRILSLLGAGGMGEVYRALDLRLNREVAIKVLPDHLARDREAMARFRREARALAALSHPNILTIYDFNTGQGLSYAVTELLTGETLRARMARAPLTSEQTLEIALDAAEGLSAAHDKGITHRDLKPENIFLTAEDVVKILDFGLAHLAATAPLRTLRAEGAAQTTTHLTNPGKVMGTPAYMSPEQALGQELDARTDLFSFGVMLYEMATGCAPFRGETPAAVFAELLKHEPPPVRDLNPDLPVELERIVGRALEKDREARYQSAKDLLADLKRLSPDVSSRPAAASAGVANRRKAHSAAKPRRMRAALIVALIVAAAGALLLSGLAVWRSLIPRRRAESPSVRRLTFNPAADFHPVFSPDDRRVAFISNRDGKTALFVMSADGGDARRITDVSYGSSFPQWSPDGKRIAFESSRDGGGIFLVNPDGSDMVKLIDNAGWPAWSPDGKRIAFHRRAPESVEIYVVNLSGGDPVRLTNDAVFDANPSWSPDGAQIGFSRATAPGALNIFVMNADGSGQRPLTSFKAWVGGPLWSPDGKRIAFGMSSDMAVIDHAVYLMEPDGSGIVKLPWFNKNNSGQWFSWSRDGKRLVTTSEQTGDDEIYIVSAEFSADTRLTRHVADDFQPDWSPDGKQIVFVSARDGGRAIYAMNADGSDVRKLHDLDWRTIHVRPRWSPDGVRIAFAEARDGASDVCSMSANGADLKRLTDPPASDGDPFWFPDGNRILFSSVRDGKQRLYTMNADGRDRQRIAQVSLAAGLAALSPDGKKIVFVGKEQSRENEIANDLYLVGLNSGRPRKLSPVVGEYGPPAWSPDGQKIAVGVSNEDGVIIWVMDADGRRPVRLTAKGQINGGPRWSPDGSKLLYSSQRDGNAEIYVMDLTLIPLKFMAPAGAGK